MDVLEKLQAWFAGQCDGEWEHAFGVSIQTTDNPGWWVKVELRGTALEDVAFTPVKRGMRTDEDPEPPWMNCYVDEAGVFNGAGDPSTLREILEIFMEWAHSRGA